MPDIQQLLQLADDLKPWVPIAVPAVVFGTKQAHALVRRFAEHYKHDAPETRDQAIANGADAVQRIRDEVNKRVALGELTVEQAEVAFQRPDIAKPVQDALLAASETPIILLHEELARLIGARLVAPQDSSQNTLLRMACDQLRYLNSRQLRLLGLTFAALYIEPNRPNLEGADDSALDRAYVAYLSEVNDTIAPFRGLEFPKSLDFMHFEELGLAKLSSWTARMGRFSSKDISQSGLLAPLQREFYSKVLATLNTQTPRNPLVQWINALMEGDDNRERFGLKAAKLTPVGYIVGDCMYCIAHGQPFNLRGLGFGEES